MQQIMQPEVIPEFSETDMMSLAEAVQRKTKMLRFVVPDLQQDSNGARGDADQTYIRPSDTHAHPETARTLLKEAADAAVLDLTERG